MRVWTFLCKQELLRARKKKQVNLFVGEKNCFHEGMAEGVIILDEYLWAYTKEIDQNQEGTDKVQKIEIDKKN